MKSRRKTNVYRYVGGNMFVLIIKKRFGDYEDVHLKIDADSVPKISGKGVVRVDRYNQSPHINGKPLSNFLYGEEVRRGLTVTHLNKDFLDYRKSNLVEVSIKDRVRDRRIFLQGNR